MALFPVQSGTGRGSDGFLHPALPALLIGSRLVGGGRGTPARGAYTFQPRAEQPSSGTNNANSKEPSSLSSSSCNGGAAAQNSAAGAPWFLSLQKPSFTGAFIGIGAGGACFIGGSGNAKAVALWPFAKSSPPAEAVGEKDKRRVLILMSLTGGGHKASAEALRAAFYEKYGDDYQIDIVDLWKDHTPPPFSAMPNSYSFLVRHSLLWRLSYEVTQPKFFHVPYLGFVGCFMRGGINKAFDHYQPDLVVSVHPLMQHIPIRVLKQRIRSGNSKLVNFATVVTDFTTCHNTWFHRDATRCFVPTDYCAMLARDNGLEDEQIIQHGLPIRPVFSKPLASRKTLRKSLGLDPNLPSILLVGGGEGMGALEETVTQLDIQLADKAQVVVICGRNKALLQRLNAKVHPGGIKILACGFVDNIHEWMAACDCIITKAGPGTIAEALISGLPILLNGNVPCQEEGNIPYVIDNGVGTFETHPNKIAHIMHNWLLGTPQQQADFAAMAKRARALGRPDAVFEIVQDLASLADAPDLSWGPAKVSTTKKAMRNVARKEAQALRKQDGGQQVVAGGQHQGGVAQGVAS